MNNVLFPASGRLAEAVRVLNAAAPAGTAVSAFATVAAPTTLSVADPSSRAHAAVSAGIADADQGRLAAQIGGPGIVKYPLDAGD